METKTSKIGFSIKEFYNFSLIEFVIKGGIIDPSDLKNVELPPVPYNKGAAISGRGPVWLYANLAHLLHPARWVGTYEPRMNSIIVVASHVNHPQPGDVIPLE